VTGQAGSAGSLGRRLSERLTGFAYQLGWKLVCRVPEPWAQWTFTEVADIAWRRQGPKVQVLEANLHRVLSYSQGSPEVDGEELRALSRATLRSYARYWLETFRRPVIPIERFVAGMHIAPEGEAALFADLKAGRGVVIALPHMGNFEQAGAWVVASGAGSFTTVMERLKPESVYEAFVRFRQSLGMEVLPLTGGRSPFGILAQRLRAGGLVCLVSDRDLTESGVEVELFGEKARIAAGPAALAVQTGAALMPVGTWFEGDDWGAHIYEEIPVPADGNRAEKVAAMSQQLARVFEATIAEHPQDWHMLQRVFTADLDPARLSKIRTDGSERAVLPQRDAVPVRGDDPQSSPEPSATGGKPSPPDPPGPPDPRGPRPFPGESGP
jgi:phosphatidylinositol dimannoside acyltransferase